MTEKHKNRNTPRRWHEDVVLWVLVGYVVCWVGALLGGELILALPVVALGVVVFSIVSMCRRRRVLTGVLMVLGVIPVAIAAVFIIGIAVSGRQHRQSMKEPFTTAAMGSCDICIEGYNETDAAAMRGVWTRAGEVLDSCRLEVRDDGYLYGRLRFLTADSLRVIEPTDTIYMSADTTVYKIYDMGWRELWGMFGPVAKAAECEVQGENGYPNRSWIMRSDDL